MLAKSAVGPELIERTVAKHDRGRAWREDESDPEAAAGHRPAVRRPRAFSAAGRGFSSVKVLSYLKRAGHGFIVIAVVRGRKPQRGKNATGLRALQKKINRYYRHRLQGEVDGKPRSPEVTVCVAGKRYGQTKSGARRTKKLTYAIWKVRHTPKEIREQYRKRFGIETSDRQMNEARIRTYTREPAQRLLFVGVALVLRNVWVWLHFKLTKVKWSEEPQLFLPLLRFREMLLWISQVVDRRLGADRVSKRPAAHA